ncbi:MAG: hypothetical protein ACK52S_04035, partial [Pirellula sp.]
PAPFNVLPNPVTPEKFSCRHVRIQVVFSAMPTTEIALEVRAGTTGGIALPILPKSVPTKSEQLNYDIEAVIWGDEAQLNDATLAINVTANGSTKRISVMPIES